MWESRWSWEPCSWPVAAAKARQDGPKNGRPSEIRITSDGVAAAKARQDGPKKVALLEPAFGLTAAPELITTRIGQIKLKRVPAGEFMMRLEQFGFWLR